MSEKKAKRRRAIDGARRALDIILRAYIRIVRGLYKASAPAYYERFPNARRPCHTCAFNPGTDNWKGFDTTMVRLNEALSEGKPFFCHEGTPWKQEGWRPNERELAGMHLCGGYAVVMNDPSASSAMLQAVVETKSEVPIEALQCATARRKR